MERIGDTDRGIADQRHRVARASAALAEACGDDHARFARAWRATAEGWDFRRLNELIEQHNEWYPIERDLPMDSRTRDYVLIDGRSFRRPLLGPAGILEQFPAAR